MLFVLFPAQILISILKKLTIVIVIQDYPKPAHESVDLVINYESPVIQMGKYHFAEHFDDPKTFDEKWVKSAAKKGGDDAYDGVWSVEVAENPILRNDLGLVLKSKARHSAVSSRLIKPFVFDDKPLIVQYEVQMQVSVNDLVSTEQKKNKLVLMNNKNVRQIKIYHFYPFRRVKNVADHISNCCHPERKLRS